MPDPKTNEPLSPHGLSGVLVPVENIQPSASNPRKHFDKAKLEELTASVKVHGVLQPILVRPIYRLGQPRGRFSNGAYVAKDTYWDNPGAWPTMGFELVAGERRLRAAQAAELDRVPVIIRDLTDKQVLEIQVIENEQRDDLSPLEKARGYQVLVQDHSYKVEDLAGKVGKSPATIYGLLKLLDLPDKAYKAVESGELAMSTAQLIARVPNERARAELLKVALHKNWEGNLPSCRHIQETIKRQFMIELKQAPFSQKDEALVSEAGSCQACPKRTGNDRANYPDARADVCTDPECYRNKLKRHTERTLALAKEGGKKVLAGKDAERALGYQSGYYDLKDQCYEHPKKKSYKQLVGEDLADQVVIAVDDMGVTHRLVPKAAANEVLKTKHKIKRGSYGVSDPKDFEDRKKRIEDGKLRRAQQWAILKAVADKTEELFVHAELPPDDVLINQVLRPLCDRAISNVWGSVRDLVSGRRGGKGKASDLINHVKGQILAMGAPRLLGLLVELHAAGTLHAYEPDRGKTVWQPLGIDRKQIERDTKEALKAGKPAKVAKPSTNGHAKKQPSLTEHVTDLEKQLEAESDADAKPTGRWGRPNPTKKKLSPASQKVMDAHKEYLKARAAKAAKSIVPTCRVCGCTNDDCHQCIEKTGKPCHWVEMDLCSACEVETDPACITLRELPFSTRAKGTAITALARFGVVSIKDAIDRAQQLGMDVADALGTIPGVGKPSAVQLAADIQALTGETAGQAAEDLEEVAHA